MMMLLALKLVPIPSVMTPVPAPPSTSVPTTFNVVPAPVSVTWPREFAVSPNVALPRVTTAPDWMLSEPLPCSPKSASPETDNFVPVPDTDTEPEPAPSAPTVSVSRTTVALALTDSCDPPSLLPTVNPPMTCHNDPAPETVTAEPPEPDWSPMTEGPDSSELPPFTVRVEIVVSPTVRAPVVSVDLDPIATEEFASSVRSPSTRFLIVPFSVRPPFSCTPVPVSDAAGPSTSIPENRKALSPPAVVIETTEFESVPVIVKVGAGVSWTICQCPLPVIDTLTVVPSPS